MSKILRMLSKDLESLFRERSYISIIILQIILFSTARSFTAGVILISDPDRAAEIFDFGAMVEFGSSHNNSLTQKFSSRGISVEIYSDTEKGIEALEQGEIDIFLLSQGNLDSVVNSQERIVFDVYYSEKNPRKELSLLLLKSGMESFKREVQNIRYGGEDIFFNIMNADLPEDIGELEMLYTFTIPLLLLFSVIISGSLVIDLITEEVERKTLENLVRTSATLREVMVSKSLLPGILTGIMGFFWVTVFAFQGIFVQNILVLLIFLFCLSLIYCSFGLLICSIFKKNRHSQTIYTVVIMLSLLFITGTSTRIHPAFIVADLSMDPGFALWPVAFWALLSLVIYVFSTVICIHLFPEF